MKPPVTRGFRTIGDALDGLRTGRVTAVDLVKSAFAAADAVDGELGVYLARFDEQALAAAEAADRLYAAGAPTGPLAGIPLGVKDIISTVEGPTTAQSLVHDRAWGAGIGDAVVIKRLREAGAVITGKLTTMEFASGMPDATKPFPIPRNPWNLDRWAGGSSSGTGNGVAAGVVLGGLGTDTGGSIRGPAAFCGVSGLKTTFGRVPKSGCVPLGYSLDTIGPMARSAKDCAILLGVIAGDDADDPCAAAESVDDYAAGLHGDLTGLTIGFDRGPGTRAATFAGRDPALDGLLDDVVAALTGRGATVTEITLPLWDELCAATHITAICEAYAYHRPDLTTRWNDYGASTRIGIGAAQAVTGADYVQAQRVRRFGQRAVAAIFERVDAILTPTSSMAAWPIDGLELMDRYESMHTAYWNAVGNPALAIPMGFNRDGLPLSAQLIGRPFDELTVLRVGDAYQRRTDFHLRVPPAAPSGP